MLKHRVINSGLQVFDFLILTVCFKLKATFKPFLLTSSSCHPKVFVKEFCYFLMSCHQHCLGVNLLVQR